MTSLRHLVVFSSGFEVEHHITSAGRYLSTQNVAPFALWMDEILYDLGSLNCTT